MNLSEAEVLDGVVGLIDRRLVHDESGFNSRTKKYKHRFCNTEFGHIKLSAEETAVICCLLLRGAQTAGELRTRSNRLFQFNNTHDVEMLLDNLLVATENRPAAVMKLAREAGRREARYQQLFGDEIIEMVIESLAPKGESRLDKIEIELAELKLEFAKLRATIGS